MNEAILVGHEGLEDDIRGHLAGAARIAIVGIGDELQPRDRLGVLAARELEGFRLPGVRVFVAGTVPEAFTGPIRRFRPNHIVLIDAADMGLRPGAVAIVGRDRVMVRDLSTHALPLSLVMEYLEERTGAGVTLLAIQPDLTAEGPEPTAAEQAGLARILGCMQRCLGGREARLIGGSRGSRAL